MPSEKFVIALPPKWQQLSLEPEFWERGINMVSEQNPQLKSVLSSGMMANLVASGIKLYALDLSPESLEADFPASANVLKANLGAKIPLDSYVSLSLAQIKKFANPKFPVTHRRVTLSNVEAEEIKYEMNLTVGRAAPVPFRIVQYIIVDGSTAYVISLSCPVELDAAYAPVFEKIGQSFRLIE